MIQPVLIKLNHFIPLSSIKKLSLYYVNTKFLHLQNIFLVCFCLLSHSFTLYSSNKSNSKMILRQLNIQTLELPTGQYSFRIYSKVLFGFINHFNVSSGGCACLKFSSLMLKRRYVLQIHLFLQEIHKNHSHQ